MTNKFWDISIKLEEETFKAWQTFWTTTPALNVPDSPTHTPLDEEYKNKPVEVPIDGIFYYKDIKLKCIEGPCINCFFRKTDNSCESFLCGYHLRQDKKAVIFIKVE